MLHKAVKVRLYPTPEQQVLLSQHFGCARWWWNYALYKSIETYKETGKSLGQSALNAFLPKLKKSVETIWLSECYSQVLQATTLNLTTAYKNFFAGRARFPRYKSKHGKQSWFGYAGEYTSLHWRRESCNSLTSKTKSLFQLRRLRVFSQKAGFVQNLVAPTARYGDYNRPHRFR